MLPARAFRALLASVAFGATPAFALPGDGTCEPAAFAGGNGTATEPYRVHAATALDEVRDCLDAHFRQVAPIDLGAYANWHPIGGLPEGRQPWDPRAPRFTGLYDGGGHPITGLAISRAAGEQALFGRAGPATFINVHVRGEVMGLQRAALLLGGIAAFGGHRVVVQDSTAEGRVTSAGFAGGLVGDLRGAELVGCSDRAEVRVVPASTIAGAATGSSREPASVLPSSSTVAAGAAAGIRLPPGHADAIGLPGHYSGCGCH